jgi:3-oxoacyl-[acyl-carrier protein] reductase
LFLRPRQKEAEGVGAETRNTSGRTGMIAADLAAPDGAHTLAKQVRGIVGDCLDTSAVARANSDQVA